MVKKILVGLLLLLVVMQFLPALPANSPEPQSSLLLKSSLPENISAILNKACNDCHSSTATLPWYAHVAPVSFYIGEHIEDGRKHFNFSEWDNYNPKKKAHKIEELIEEVEEGKMPLEEYTWLHPEAKLTAEERTALIAYFKAL
jgi:mono/diheme cytochrome c family protein